MTSVIDRPDAVPGGASVRSLDEIFPLRGDVNRARLLL
jgi:hypothetical protein